MFAVGLGHRADLAFAIGSMLDRRPHRREDLQLDRHDVGRRDPLHDRDDVRHRVPHRVRHRRPERHHLRRRADRLAGDRHVLRRRALPLRALRRHGLRDLRRDLLLVPEDDRPPARRAAGQGALLADGHRLQPDLLRPALPRASWGCRGACSRTPICRAGARSTWSRRSARSSWASSVLVFVVNLALSLRRGEGRGRQPVGRVDARVGDDLAAAARTTSSACRRSAAGARSGTSRTRARRANDAAAANERRRRPTRAWSRSGRSSSPRPASSSSSSSSYVFFNVSTKAGGRARSTSRRPGSSRPASSRAASRCTSPRRALEHGNARRVPRVARRSRSPSGASSWSGRRASTSKLFDRGVTVNSSLFATTFFTLTGFHGLHVTLGLVALGDPGGARVRRRLPRKRAGTSGRARAQGGGPLLALRRRRLARRLLGRLPEERPMTTRELLLSAWDSGAVVPFLCVLALAAYCGAFPAPPSRRADAGFFVARGRDLLLALASPDRRPRARVPLQRAHAPAPAPGARRAAARPARPSARARLAPRPREWSALARTAGPWAARASARCGSGTRGRSATPPRGARRSSGLQTGSLLVDGARVLAAHPRARVARIASRPSPAVALPVRGVRRRAPSSASW